MSSLSKRIAGRARNHGQLKRLDPNQFRSAFIRRSINHVTTETVAPDLSGFDGLHAKPKRKPRWLLTAYMRTQHQVPCPRFCEPGFSSMATVDRQRRATDSSKRLSAGQMKLIGRRLKKDDEQNTYAGNLVDGFMAGPGKRPRPTGKRSNIRDGRLVFARNSWRDFPLHGVADAEEVPECGCAAGGPFDRKGSLRLRGAKQAPLLNPLLGLNSWPLNLDFSIAKAQEKTRVYIRQTGFREGMNGALDLGPLRKGDRTASEAEKRADVDIPKTLPGIDYSAVSRASRDDAATWFRRHEMVNDLPATHLTLLQLPTIPGGSPFMNYGLQRSDFRSLKKRISRLLLHQITHQTEGQPLVGPSRVAIHAVRGVFSKSRSAGLAAEESETPLPRSPCETAILHQSGSGRRFADFTHARIRSVQSAIGTRVFRLIPDFPTCNKKSGSFRLRNVDCLIKKFVFAHFFRRQLLQPKRP